jgi:hypothetical protein
VENKGIAINFAHRSFRWSNSASNNAGVTCVVIGMGPPRPNKRLFDGDQEYKVSFINPYLAAANTGIVTSRTNAISKISGMNYGNYPGDGNHLTLTAEDRDYLVQSDETLQDLILPLFGAQEFIKGLNRYCLWIDDADLARALANPFISDRVERVKGTRLNSIDASYNKLASRPHQFRDRNIANEITILAPTVSSERRNFLPVAVFAQKIVTTNQAFALYDAPLWNMALIASRVHLVWIATVCGKMKTDFRYSNTLGWNTFPVPTLTENNKAELTRCAEDILLAREAHFPATIAQLYAKDDEGRDLMPADLRRAHDRNDETLERIYIGRRFKNDTERLEKLFDLYTKMTKAEAAKAPASKSKPRKSAARE